MIDPEFEPTRYSSRVADLIRGRAMRYAEHKNIKPDALAGRISDWDGILKWFPDAHDQEMDKDRPITARLFYTWFNGDTSRGERRWTTPRPTALDAIAHFLVEERFILKEELSDNADVGLALAFQEFLPAADGANDVRSWIGEYGLEFPDGGKQPEMRLRLTSEFEKGCLTAETFIRTLKSWQPARLQKYIAADRGWAYPVASGSLIVVLHATGKSEKRLWILQRASAGVQLCWSSSFSFDADFGSRSNERATKTPIFKSLTRDRPSLYYKEKRVIGGEVHDDQVMGNKYTVDIANTEVFDLLLLRCAIRDDAEGAAYALSRGANINFVEPHEGTTAFHKAVRYGSIDVIRLLIADERLDPTILDASGGLASRWALIALDDVDMHIDLKELEDRWIERRKSSSIQPPTPPSPS